MSVFEHKIPTVEQRIGLRVVKERYERLYEDIEYYAPPSRYRSIALTKLEELAMWVNKAITHGAEGDQR